MVEVTFEDIPLQNDDAVLAALTPFNLTPKRGWESMPPEVGDSGPRWRQYLDYGELQQQWGDGVDHWIVPVRIIGVLRQLRICGLRNEKEAKFLRSEFARRRRADGLRLSAATLQDLARQIVATRHHRDHADLFESCLRRIRDHLDWDSDQITERLKFGLSLRQLGLTEKDVATMYAVFERLPRSERTLDQKGRERVREVRLLNDPCPRCGQRPKKSVPRSKRRAKLLQELSELNRQQSHDTFGDWVQDRLRPSASSFTPASVLYGDFCEWAKEHGITAKDRRLAKDTLLSMNAWGRRMISRGYVRRRRNAGYVYRAALKKAKQRQ